jgi:hypothetical protein
MLGSIGCAVAGGLAGVVVVRAMGWPEGAEGASGLVPACLVGGGVVAVVGVISAILMQAYAAGDPRRVGNALLAGSGMRLLGLLAGGVLAAMIVQADRPMWIGLLCAGMMALVLDTWILLSAAGRPSPGAAAR